MKALRLSPSSRRQERSGALASLFSLNHQLCLELDMCVHSAASSTQPPLNDDVSMLVTVKSLPLTDSCLCQRIGQWLGHANSSNECSTCDLEASSVASTTEPASLLVVRAALSCGEFEAAATQAAALLAAGADPDETDAEGRTLLSHSAQHLDDAVALTRLLLNSGASVWQGGAGGADHSPFTWLLRALILRRRFENCDLTLQMLAVVMAERPHQMKAHVLRVMFRHARCPKVLGPIFKQIKEAVSGYWTRPQSLQFSCLRVVRRRLGSDVAKKVPHLGLPPPMQRCLLLQQLL